MERNEICIKDLLEMPYVNVENLWYDWFCRESSLENKGNALLAKLRMISKSKKFDTSKTYVFFKNNCPCVGSLYDDFRICDMETGDVLYTVTPKSGFPRDEGKGNVWGKENNFQEPLFKGSWKEIKAWFLADTKEAK